MPDPQLAEALARLKALPDPVDDVAATTERGREGFDLVLGGVHVPVLSGRVERSIDQVAWSWTAEVAWRAGADPGFDKLVRPYGYTEAKVYLDGTRVLTGYLYRVEPKLAADGSTLVLEGASKTAELVDSCIPADQWKDQWDKLSVWSLCLQIVPPMGIDAWTDINQSDLPLAVVPFESIQHEPTDTYAELITRLAFQRGMLVTTNSRGDLVLTIAHVGTNYVQHPVRGDREWSDFLPGSPAAILLEGRPPVTEWQAAYDGRKRFHEYTAIGQDDLGDPVVGKSTDAVVPSRRRLRFSAGGDNTPGNIGTVAEWRRNTAVADAMALRLLVAGWTPLHDSKLWTPNTLVTVQAPSLFLGDATTMLLRGTDHVLGAEGRMTTLDLVPPETYGGGAVKESWATKASLPKPYVEGEIED